VSSRSEGGGPGQFVDARLRELDVGRWTDVPIPSLLAARAISFYLINEHPLVAALDADLFVRDLVRGEGDFCSPLLASALLAWACVGFQPLFPSSLLATRRLSHTVSLSQATYSQADPQANQLSKAMFEEAERRWRTGGHIDSPMNVSAAVFLILTCNHHGKDLDGVYYLDASAGMGRRLHLFDTSDMSASPPQPDDSEARRAASHAAWGAFGWHRLVG